MVSDGGYTTMLATWFMLAWLVAFSGWLTQFQADQSFRPAWKSVSGVGLLFALALLGHTAMLLLAGTMLALFLGLGLVLLLFSTGSKTYRPLLFRSGIMAGVGLILAFASYYGFYAVALIGNTLPTIAGELGQGKSIGGHAQTLKGFWDELLVHFHLLPFLVTIGILSWLSILYLLGRKISWFGRDYNTQIVREIGILSWLLYLAWAATFLVFSLIDTRINLLQKHMLFAIPLFALGVGLALAVLLDYLLYRAEKDLRPGKIELKPGFWLGRLLVAGVIIWFVAAGGYTWYVRVINYILPAGTG